MKMSDKAANMWGEKLYAEISAAYDAVSVAACKEAGIYSPAVTAGKMTGMILEAHTEVEMRAILADPTRIAALMMECVDAICAHEKRRVATEKNAWSALIRR